MPVPLRTRKSQVQFLPGAPSKDSLFSRYETIQPVKIRGLSVFL